MSVKPLSMPTKRLAVAITSAATTFQVSNIKGWDGSNVTSANFGSIGFVVFRDSANTKMEIMQFDPSTIASASITITTRGLDFNGATAAVAANALAWPANDTLVDFGSDPAQLFTAYANLGITQTISAVWTFGSGATPKVTDAPASATEVANKAYVDGIAIAGSPDATTTTKGISKMSVAPVSATSPIAVGDNDTRVPTIAQTASLVGDNTDIAVGSGNKMVTQTGLQKQAEAYAADSGSANAYAVTLAPVPTSYATGMTVRFKALNANTTTSTLNVNGLGAKTINKQDGATALIANDIKVGQLVQVTYDGTNFVMTSQTGTVPVDTSVKSYASAYTTTTSTTTQNIDTTFTTTFLPKAITIFFTIQGTTGGGTAKYSTGFATFDGATAKATMYIYSGLATNIALNSNTQVPVFAAAAPTVGTVAASDIKVTLTVSSVSATTFVVRAAYDQTGGGSAPAGVCNFFCTATQ